MTKKQCYRCYYYNEANERNTLGIIGHLIEEWCDISEGHNKFLMSDKKCPYFKDDFKGDIEGCRMTTKRYMLDEGLIYDNGKEMEDVVGVLNSLSEENKQLKEQLEMCKDARQSYKQDWKACVSYCDTYKDEIHTLKDNIQGLIEENKQLKKEIEELEEENTQLGNRLYNCTHFR